MIKHVGRGMALTILLASAAFAQPRIEKNVVFGMYSGLALLMDVYHPVQSNGLGLIVIEGSGFYMPQRYDAPALKDRGADYARRFAEAGYTAFVINHRATPRFRYPAPIEDAQRAVRFIRHNASSYGIDGRRLGAWGASSGGHLAALLGTLEGTGDPNDADPVNGESAKVQAVVALFPATDLASFEGPAAPFLAMLMGFAYTNPTFFPPGFIRPDEPEIKGYRDASPTTHVTRDDAPVLLMHGDADIVVPIQQSEIMEQRLKSVGVAVRLIRVSGGQHGPNFLFLGPNAKDPRRPDDVGEATKWFDQYLKAIQ
jgi:acetyl esterase/lipase